MKNLSLDFTQRFQLCELLGRQQGKTLAESAPYWRMIKAVRFTDAENKLITKTQLPDGRIGVNPPANQPEFGKLTVDIEDGDAEQLRTLLDMDRGLKPADHEWADPIFEALRP